MIKKIICSIIVCFALALVLVGSVSSVTIYADETKNNSFPCKENPDLLVEPYTIWGKQYLAVTGYKGNGGAVTIPDNCGICEIKANAFAGNKSITSVILPKTVTIIGDNAFCSCKNLATIKGLNNVENFGMNVFSGTKWLKKKEKKNNLVVLANTIINGSSAKGDVVIPEGVIEIRSNEFSENRDITSVTFPKSLRLIDWGAFACSTIERIKFSNSETYISSRAFRDCYKLKSIQFGKSKIIVEDNSVFMYCHNISVIKNIEALISIPDRIFENSLWIEKKRKAGEMVIINNVLIDGRGVKGNVVIPKSVFRIGEYSFSHNDDIISVTIPETVKYIGDGAFYGDDALKTVKVKSEIENIGRHCFSYTTWAEKQLNKQSFVVLGTSIIESKEQVKGELIIPSNITRICKEAFANDRDITKLVIGKNVKVIEDKAFFNCTNLKKVEKKGKRKISISSTAFEDTKLYDKQMKKNGMLVIGDEIVVAADNEIMPDQAIIPNGVKEIPDRAFYNRSMKSIKIPDSVERIGNEAFFNCDSLESIEIPPSVISIGEMAFCYCSNLSKVYLSLTVQIGTDAFKYCPSDNLYINKNASSVIREGDFQLQSSTMIRIPNGITKIGVNAFKDNKELETIILPDSVTEIDDGAFQGCTNLSAVTFFQTASLTRIGNNAFRDCIALNHMYIPESVSSIGKYAFCGCSNLNTISIHKNCPITEISEGFAKDCFNLLFVHICESVQKIGDYAFTNTALNEIVFTDSITEIGERAFDGCKNLTYVNLSKATKIVGHAAFSNCANLLLFSIPIGIDEVSPDILEGCPKLIKIILPEKYYGTLTGISPETEIVVLETAYDSDYSVLPSV